MGKKKPPASNDAVRNNPFAGLAPTEAPAGVGAPRSKATEVAVPASVANPFAAKLVVRREKRGRGGKTITRLSGVAEEARQDVAKRMKKALGCGALVEGDDVILLGSLVDRAADWLDAQGAKKIVRAN